MINDDLREMTIAVDDLAARVGELGDIGRVPEGGLFRGVYSEAWREAVEMVEGWLEGFGLETWVDPVGNLFGRLPGRDAGRAIVTGSHIDTVKNGGAYDGALGIHAAISAVTALRQAVGTPAINIDVIAICEEEGSRFHSNLWGSRALLGWIDPSECDLLLDAEGTSIGDAMVEVGLDPRHIPDAQRDDIDAFIELHIEQGRTLFETDLDIGVVEAITGQRHYVVAVRGRADHAGTTPMDLRRDAFLGACHMVTEIAELATRFGRPAVATIGDIEVSPGAINVVPGTCIFKIDTRHADPERRLELTSAIEDIVNRIAERSGLSVDLRQLLDHDPVPMDPKIQNLIRHAAEAEGSTYASMPSGAGHDSQAMAQRFPTGMIFVPSVEGRSHSPAEHTPIERIVPGVRVLARALYSLAY